MQIQLTPTWPAFRNSYILLHATVSPSIHPSIHPLVVQWLNHVQLLATPRTSTGQAPLSFTMSWSVLKLMSFESVVLSKHLILCHTLHLFPSVLPSIRVFSNKSALLIRWLKYWSFSISPSVNIQGWFPWGWGFPYSSAGKEPSCKAGDLGSIPGLGRSPGEGKSYPLQYSDLENSMDWAWSPCSPRDSQESTAVPQFKSINSSVRSFLYSPTLTSIHDYWKTHSFDYTDCWQSDVYVF